MGIKSYSPYTPSRRHMTGSDFSEITKSTTGEILSSFFKEETQVVTTRVKSPFVTEAAVPEENIESSTSREMQKTVSQQPYLVSSTIRTVQQTSL